MCLMCRRAVLRGGVRELDGRLRCQSGENAAASVRSAPLRIPLADEAVAVMSSGLTSIAPPRDDPPCQIYLRAISLVPLADEAGAVAALLGAVRRVWAGERELAALLPGAGPSLPAARVSLTLRLICVYFGGLYCRF